MQKEEIRIADEAWLGAAASKDVEQTLSFWSSDATVIAPGEPPRVGHDEIRSMIQGLFGLEGSSISWDVSRIEMYGNGGVGYAYWTNRIDFGLASGLSIFYGQGVSTWTKQHDEGWKVTIDIWNEQQRQS